MYWSASPRSAHPTEHVVVDSRAWGQFSSCWHNDAGGGLHWADLDAGENRQGLHRRSARPTLQGPFRSSERNPGPASLATVSSSSAAGTLATMPRGCPPL